ncbi:hypothetical protein CEXT_251621 [Caerostris extrusa]|uniref:Uncharacterized protein n=1 Tax=Caerostris extrusa TaxID=172846 RepID=A0AAV4SCM1_CAEEX|nr:hypothetical protein CEXT_251621 [Caerostris extrusa]
MLSNFEPSSLFETSQIEHEYQRKAERMLGDERCLKVVWHNNIHTLAVEILEHESDRKRLIHMRLQSDPTILMLI